MLFLPPPAAQATATVELVRGAPLGNPGYWAVEDTYLDKAEPTQDHGGGFTILSGDGRTALIRFGDLNRVVGPGRRVIAATLVLTPSGGDVPQISGVTAVDTPWGEGPWATFTRILANVESKPGAKPTEAARGAATWTERRAGVANWPSPGATGGTKVEITGGPNGRTYGIAGLGPTVQGWLDHPWTNHGLALSFPGDVEFFSSQSPSGRPRLVLETGPVTLAANPFDRAVSLIDKTNGHWTAYARAVGPTKGRWWVDGKPGPEANLSPDGTATYTGPEPKDDPQVPTLAFGLEGEDAHPSNDRLDVFPGGKPVELRVKPDLDPQAVVAYWNETVATQSRFSFAPEGVKGRVRLEKAESAPDGAATLAEALRQIGAQLGLPSPASPQGDLYPGLMGYGDTRFEGGIPGKLPLSYEPYPNPATATALLEPTGLLSATDVGRLNDGTDRLPLPKVTVITVTDLSGRPLPGLQATLEGPGQSAQKITTNPGGAFFLPSTIAFRNDLSNGTLVLTAAQSGTTASDAIKAWRLSDAYRRAASPAVALEVRLNLPMLPLETGTDLAEGKAVADSTGKPYAYGSPLPTEPGAWVELDLGRDRTIGEIALKLGPAFWSRYEIRAYETGGKPADASLWAVETESLWSRANRAEDGWIAYRAPTQRVRYLRIVSKTGGPASLAAIRVVPVKITAPAP